MRFGAVVPGAQGNESDGRTPLIIASTLYSDNVCPRHSRSNINLSPCAARPIFKLPLIFKWQALVV